MKAETVRNVPRNLGDETSISAYFGNAWEREVVDVVNNEQYNRG